MSEEIAYKYEKAEKVLDHVRKLSKDMVEDDLLWDEADYCTNYRKDNLKKINESYDENWLSRDYEHNYIEELNRQHEAYRTLVNLLRGRLRQTTEHLLYYKNEEDKKPWSAPDMPDT